jgi:hypothetical protein
MADVLIVNASPLIFLGNADRLEEAMLPIAESDAD